MVLFMMHTHTVKDYLISVIIPVYNGVEFLPTALESLKNQSIGFDNLEIILVDDCSSDDSFFYCTVLSNQFKNIKFYHTKFNHGTPSFCRNLGLSKVESDFFTFLDQDDELYPDSLLLMYLSMIKVLSEEESINLLLCNFDILEDGIVHSDFNNSMYIKYCQNKDLWNLKLDKFFTPSFMTAWSNLYRTKYFKKNQNIRFMENILNEDFQFLLQYYLQEENYIAYTNLPVYQYNLRKKSLSNQFNARNIKLQLQGFNEIYKLLKKHDKEEIGKKFYNDSINYMKKELIENNKTPLIKFIDEAQEWQKTQ